VIAAVVVLAVALVGVLAFALQRSSALSKARAAITELEARVATLDADLSAANNRADVADAKSTKAVAEAAAATKRAETAEADAKDANARATSEGERADAMTARAEAAEAALRQLPADGLWALETRRIGRVYRDRVSVTLDGSSPIPRAEDQGEAAARVLADASREEAGVVVDLAWTIGPPPTGSERLMVVRLAEELIAEAWSTDGADLEVSADEQAIELRLRADPPVHASAELADALHGCGADVSFADGAIVVRVARLAPTGPAPREA
jgi:type II secretory ATPase GspE/PulE/Tfp pilus assembly ATPase PilB-like protein